MSSIGAMSCASASEAAAAQLVVERPAAERRFGVPAADDGRRHASERDADVANDLAVEIRRGRKADLRNRLRLARADLPVRLNPRAAPVAGSVMLLMISSAQDP